MAVKGKYEPTQEDLDFMRYAVKEYSEEQDVPWYKSYPSAAARGIIKGVIGVGEMMSGGELDPRKRKEGEAQREQLLNEYLPLGSSFGPRAVERGTTAVTMAPAFPGGGTLQSLGRAAAGGAAAEGVKELGGPDWLQAVTEIGVNLAPGMERVIPSHGLTQASRAERRLAEEARRLGLTEEELALTLNRRGPMTDFLTEISAKGGRTVERFDRTRQALGRVWDNLRGSPAAQNSLNGQQSSQLINNLSNRLSQLPAEQRNRILNDYNDLLGSQMRGDDIINFWQDLNYYIADGDRGLGVLKEDLQSALMQISPELGRDFRTTNELYGNFHRLAERMGPNIAENLIRAGENGIVVTAISTGNYPLLKKVIGPLAARQLATEMTTNPRLMNLSSRFLNSLERRLPISAKKIYDQMLIEVGKTNAEAAMKMSNLDLDNLFEALDQENQEKEENQ